MTFADLLSLVGAILLGVGGGAAIVFALSKWLGGVWAERILENERNAAAREHELLGRRRNVYTKLALSMRVFLDSGGPPSNEQRHAFLAAYDEAALWAAEEVVHELGKFLDMLVQIKAMPHSVGKDALRAEFVHCITVMRRDCGFPQSQYAHRIVTF